MSLPGLDGLGRVLIIVGAVLVVAGLVLHYGGSVGLGRLPGDILIRRGNFVFYFPLATMVLLSVVLTIILSLLRRP